MKKYGVSLVEVMIAVAILGVGLAVIVKLFGKSGYIVGKSKWELLAMSVANGVIEVETMYSGDFDNIDKCSYDWRELTDKDFPVLGKVPEDYKNAEYKKKLEIKRVNDFIAEVTVSVKWYERTVDGRKEFQLNIPMLLSNPKYFNKLK